MKKNMHWKKVISLALLLTGILGFSASQNENTWITPPDVTPTPVDNLPERTGYPIVGANQTVAYGLSGTIALPGEGDAVRISLMVCQV